MTPFPRRSRSIRRRLLAVIGTLCVVAGMAVSASATAAADDTPPVWDPVDVSGEQTELGLRDDAPVAAFDVDVDAILPSAATRQHPDGSMASRPTHLQLPDPTGAFIDFVVTPTSVMEDALAARHPEIQSYAGHAADDPTVSVWASVTPLGLTASVRSGDNNGVAWYVDPLPSDAGDARPRHISFGRDAARSDIVTEALTDTADAHLDDAPVAAPDPAPDGAARGVSRQVVRLALANDPTFATFYGTENVLAAKVAIVTRVAQIYNDDLGVQLLLIDDTEKLNFDTDAVMYRADGPCGIDPCYTRDAMSWCDDVSLEVNASAFARVLRDEEYDVGHIALGNGGGGFAWNSVVGVDYRKAGGCTGMTDPVGDVFAVDFVAHELGHQFGAQHTQNACFAAEPHSAFEPGSASTIMGYAGICGDDDLQTNSDPYFSAFSIDQMHSKTGTAATHVPSSNSAPIVTAPESRTIPLRTPFALTASGIDPDGDALTYLWEQENLGDLGRALHDPHKVDGPLFRVFSRAADLTAPEAHEYYAAGHNEATSNATRVFPDMEQILRGATNAHTGTCDFLDRLDARDCYSEFLPTEVYQGNGVGGMDFRVAARDQRPDGGAVGTARVRLLLDHDAGPFEVTSFATAGDSVVGGTSQRVTWAVRGTDAVGLAPDVKITLSLDGGRTFDHVLAAQTPNDGDEIVTLPNTATDAARIKIEAVDNYFFAVNAADFAITHDDTPTPTPTPTPTTTAGPITGPTQGPIGQPTAGPTALPGTSVAPTGAPIPPPSLPVATLSGSSVEQGGAVQVTVTNLASGEQVAAELRSRPITVTGIPVADAQGRVSFTVRIPAALEAGPHTIVVFRGDGSELARLPIDVFAKGTLATTGAQAPLGLALVGAALLLVGVAAGVGRRPRRRSL